MAGTRRPLLGLVNLAFFVAAAAPVIAQPNELNYKVSARTLSVNGGPPGIWDLLTVRGGRVILANGRYLSGPGLSDVSMSCPDFFSGATLVSRLPRGTALQDDYIAVDGNATAVGPIAIMLNAPGQPSARVVLQGIQDACDAQASRDGILVVVRAAQESDPFASIRGDFDLSAADSRQWKTRIELPYAEKCGLFKTPLAPPASTSVWSFTCTFRTAGDGYERMVKSVQSVLNLPYQPDETAVDVNQVFFTDPAKPSWRLYVARMNGSSVGISVIAVGSAGATPTFPNIRPFPGPLTQLPTAPTVRDEIETIRGGRYLPLPVPVSGSCVPHSGTGALRVVENGTLYQLRLLFSGPVDREVTISPGQKQSVSLPAGQYKVAGSVNATNVRPFYGEETYKDAEECAVQFYVR
jgi:hypothetical protein